MRNFWISPSRDESGDIFREGFCGCRKRKSEEGEEDKERGKYSHDFFLRIVKMLFWRILSGKEFVNSSGVSVVLY